MQGLRRWRRWHHQESYQQGSSSQGPRVTSPSPYWNRGWHSYSTLAGSRSRSSGQREVKCQEWNVNWCWQAVQKTCSVRLREPWYFTKSNEHVSRHRGATSGLFKRKQADVTSQAAGNVYVELRWTKPGLSVALIRLLQGSSTCETPAAAATNTSDTHCFTLASSCWGLDTGPVLSVSSSGTCCAPYSLSWDCRLHRSFTNHRSGTSWVMASFLVWGSEKVMLHSNPVDADTQVQLRPTEFTCNTKRFPRRSQWSVALE